MTQSVLIVGAGPVGMTLASELARFGVPVRIVDKAAARTDKSKALVLWSRTLELLERGGSVEPFLSAGFKALAVNIIADQKVVAHVSMDKVDSLYPFGLMLPQSETERLLEKRLLGQGVTVERRVELLNFKSHSNQAGSPGEAVEAVLGHADGREETVAAGWLVGCDGAHSTVRHQLGVPFAGETLNSDWMLADVHMTGYPVPDSEVSVYWHRDGVFVIFPICPGRYRVIADLPPGGAEQSPAPALEQVQTIIDRRGPGGLQASNPVWLAGFRINGRKVASYRHGRIFLAGDAAHVHSPAGGQGMNTGMQDAFNLAWKLALVIHNRCGDDLLDSFSPERSAVGDEVLKNAGRLTAVATMKNPIAQTVRNLVGRLVLGIGSVQHAMADQLTEVSIGYPKSPLNGHSLHGVGPKPGERLGPTADRKSPGSGTAPLFVLYGAKTPATADLIIKHTGLLNPDIRLPLHDDGLWLVRPDGYVACSSRDLAVIDAYLDELAGGNR